MAKKKKDLEAHEPPPPDIQSEVSSDSPGTAKNLAFEMARFNRIPMMSKENFDKLAERLKPLGVKFELTPSKSGQFKGGKEPFAYKAKMLVTHFIVDLS